MLLSFNRFAVDGISIEVRSNTRKGSVDLAAWYFMALYPGLIAAADISGLTFTIAWLYSLIIEQFQHKIRFSSLNGAAWSHLALAETHLLRWFSSFVLLYFLLLSTFPLYTLHIDSSALEPQSRQVKHRATLPPVGWTRENFWILTDRQITCMLTMHVHLMRHTHSVTADLLTYIKLQVSY